MIPPACATSSSGVLHRKDLLEKRSKYIGNKCEIFYKTNPLVVTKAYMQYLYDENSNCFIDCNSNVQHVGHCNPTVNSAINEQLSLSSCNIRLVSSKLTECAEKLLETLPGLETVFFCNSGSEANDLALQLARDYTKNTDAIVLEHAYHGHVTSTMQLSPYKFEHGGSITKPEWVHVAPCPDVYRGKYRLTDEQLNNEEAKTAVGKKYSSEVEQIIQQATSKNRKIAAYFAEALQSCGGQVLPPAHYFSDVAGYVRSAGGLVVIDEVQTGFGRVGQTFWAYQMYNDDFTPDIITMGKPMGNGFPVSAVVTRKEIANALGGQVDYFNTYGGNPVACAAVLGVLEVLKNNNLLEHSQRMGELFKVELNKLKQKHCAIGDVRGTGMFWGIDLVKDRKTREPNAKLALKLVMKMRQEYGILINCDGPYKNILKIKPPMVFNEENLETIVSAIDKALTNLPTVTGL
ncbi:unnamed protein product [Enterobius vermicularis]|uniref:Alanine--glyoxylate aminotransferase 2-like n=1 Tax=Enterobius vermicularis TaxID=51028 RepID=A0A0N4VHI5_ENTVE|nr:unnamed protein product [Enterobius vermicularis]